MYIWSLLLLEYTVFVKGSLIYLQSKLGNSPGGCLINNAQFVSADKRQVNALSEL